MTSARSERQKKKGEKVVSIILVHKFGFLWNCDSLLFFNTRDRIMLLLRHMRNIQLFLFKSKLCNCEHYADIKMSLNKILPLYAIALLLLRNRKSSFFYKYFPSCICVRHKKELHPFILFPFFSKEWCMWKLHFSEIIFLSFFVLQIHACLL